jgi:hypothetical protein
MKQVIFEAGKVSLEALIEPYLGRAHSGGSLIGHRAAAVQGCNPWDSIEWLRRLVRGRGADICRC